MEKKNDSGPLGATLDGYGFLELEVLLAAFMAALVLLAHAAVHSHNLNDRGSRLLRRLFLQLLASASRYDAEDEAADDNDESRQT